MRALIFTVLAIGCGKQGPPIVARLDEAVAQVEKMPEENATWEAARPGDTFIMGSAVRTGAASRAHLTVGANGKLDVDPVSIVYFRRKTDKDRNELRVETGRAVLEAGDEAVSIGNAVLESGGRARIEHGDHGTTLVVEIGRMVIEDSSTVAAGDQVTLDERGRRIAVASKPEVVRPNPATMIVRISGKAARSRSSAGETAIEPGDHQLEAGASVVAPEGSVVEVIRGGAHATLAGPGALVLGNAPELLATVKAGAVVLSSDAPAAVAIPGGAIAVDRGELAAQIDAAGSTIAGRKGDALVRAKTKEQKLAPGELATLSSDGAITVLPPPPTKTVLAIGAGESPVIHDAAAPTPVRIQLGDTCPAGIVEVASDRGFKRLVARASGAGAANVLVPAGGFSYRVRCDGGKIVRGTLQVLRDGGRAQLPKTAARTLVEMDGRDYTILYQNLLPELTLSWRAATFSVGYTFVIKSASGGEKRLSSPAGKLVLPSGSLAEGTYKVWVEPAEGARSSTSTFSLEFDNATPTVEIDGVERQGDKTIVKGTVIEGANVSASGAAVQLDRHRRFTAELPAGDNAAGVRIAHPKLGVHYYVVRP